jgi:uncharacterized membrane protein YoaK (UPF0700 family)
MVNMKHMLPTLQSFNGGFVDTAGYLALQGLFTAHVTGNFVTIGAALIFGISGVVAKILALPVFCLVVFLVRLTSLVLLRAGWRVLETMLSLQLLLLLLASGSAIALGPFNNGDALSALVTGLILVAAMAIQNAIHRIHLTTAPPTTLMTGTTTQIMIDLADLIRRRDPDKRDGVVGRLKKMSVSVASFAVGAAAAAFLFHELGNWCFLVAPAVALLARLSVDEEDR